MADLKAKPADESIVSEKKEAEMKE